VRGLYFAFHYSRDIWRGNQVRNSDFIYGAKSVGFADRSLWEEARTKGQLALEQLIINGLDGTSVTAVLIGKETHTRPWVTFEIKKSIERGNALIGIRIHHLKDQTGHTDIPGKVPQALKDRRSPIHDWNYKPHDLGEWVEQAYREQCRKPGLLDWLFGG